MSAFPPSTQPWTGPGVNWAQPVSRRLILACFLYGVDAKRPPYNYVNGQLGTIASPLGSSNAGRNGGRSMYYSASPTNDQRAIPIDLSPYTFVTFSWWMWWDANSSSGQLALEYTPNSQSSVGGILVQPNGGSANFFTLFTASAGGTASFSATVRPNQGQWYHHVLLTDRTASANPCCTLYTNGLLNGQATTLTTPGSWANSTLYFMSRNNVSNTGQGRLQNFQIWGRTLSSSEILALYLNQHLLTRSTRPPFVAGLGSAVTGRPWLGFNSVFPG